ncbi:MAG TPA: CBS domain-containing protein [Candidatus Binataceae bacterium]|nr:CBS domain-containing protein [Candidatus Binataceae bacterium]
MAFPFKKILCPLDFDDNSLAALDVAAHLARNADGVVYVMHVVPMIITPTGTPIYVDMYKEQEQVAREKLKEIGRKHLSGIKHELLVQSGDPPASILGTQRRIVADLIVMATHGRKGFSRIVLGSVAEIVMREALCPVLTIRNTTAADRRRVSGWMTTNPTTVTPDEKLSNIELIMQEGGYRSVPVVKDGKLIGIVTERDLRRHTGYLPHTEAKMAMSEEVLTVTPATPIEEAARLLRERKIGALPVVEDGTLVGIVSTTDLLGAFLKELEGK